MSAQEKVDRWNHEFRVGTRVRYREMISGLYLFHDSRTASIAEIRDGIAVVRVEGRREYFPLSRVEVLA